MKILLASTSSFRRMLLERLHLEFDCVAPGVDETPHPDEAPGSLVTRLARAKASAVAARFPDSVVIGSDQVAETNGAILGKPGDHKHAVAQLQRLSAQPVRFHTALCVTAARAGLQQECTDITRVQFRALTNVEIERYLRAEQPYQCAGSFKSEGLGISLFERIESLDPTALVGLPLIATCRFLRLAGITIP